MQFLLRHPKHYSHSLAYPLLQFRSIWWPTTRFYSWLCNKLGIFCLAFNSEANDDDGDDGRSWFLLLYAPVPTNNCLKLFAIFQSVEHVNLWLFCIPIRLKYVFEGCTINSLVCLNLLVFLFCYAFIILFRHWQQGGKQILLNYLLGVEALCNRKIIMFILLWSFLRRGPPIWQSPIFGISMTKRKMVISCI